MPWPRPPGWPRSCASLARCAFQRRPSGGNKALKRVFYQSAFCSLSSPDSRAFYARKRREGKRHHQALIALARRRIDVLWAILHTRQPFQPNYPKAA
jgi:transposase